VIKISVANRHLVSRLPDAIAARDAEWIKRDIQINPTIVRWQLTNQEGAMTMTEREEWPVNIKGR